MTKDCRGFLANPFTPELPVTTFVDPLILVNRFLSHQFVRARTTLTCYFRRRKRDLKKQDLVKHVKGKPKKPCKVDLKISNENLASLPPEHPPIEFCDPKIFPVTLSTKMKPFGSFCPESDQKMAQLPSKDDFRQNLGLRGVVLCLMGPD